MNPLMILATLGKSVTDLVKLWLGHKKVKKAKQLDILHLNAESQMRQAEKKLGHEVDWDLAQAKQSKYSWRDEFWTIILAAPLIMCFIPGLEQYAVRGFENLECVPEWYIISVGVAMASAFGFRQMVSFMKKP